MPMKAKSIESGIAERDDQPAAQVAEQEQQHRRRRGARPRPGSARPCRSSARRARSGRRTGRSSTPSGSVGWISSTASLTALRRRRASSRPSSIIVDAGHDLAAPVAGHRALPDHRARTRPSATSPTVTGMPSAVVGTTTVADVVEASYEPDAADEELLAARARCSRRRRCPLFASSASNTSPSVSPCGAERSGVDDDLVGLELAAERVDLDDAGHGRRSWRDVPVEDRRAAPSGTAGPSPSRPRTGRSRRGPSRSGPSSGSPKPSGICSARLAQPLGDELARRSTCRCPPRRRRSRRRGRTATATGSPRRRAAPLSATSTGSVTNCSTSSGPRPGLSSAPGPGRS